MENLDNYEILIPNSVNHHLHISNAENQWTDSANGFQNEHVNHEHFKKAQATTVVSLLRTVMLTCTVKKFKKLMQSKQFLDITI